ncbi:MAG: phosphotransferase family protein [bacterium]
MPDTDYWPDFREYLANKLEAPGLEITSLWQNLEGWSMETYSIGVAYQKHGRAITDEIIIRKEPEAGLLDPYDASIEYRVLTALANTPVAVPRTRWYEPDPQVLGLPFYVMDKVEGHVHFWSINLDPDWKLIPDDAERESLARDFVKNIAAIHNANWRSLGLDFLEDPGPGTGAARLQVERWKEVIDRAGFGSHPIVAYASAWLFDNLVVCDSPCLVHGDYRTGNYIARNGRAREARRRRSSITNRRSRRKASSRGTERNGRSNASAIATTPGGTGTSPGSPAGTGWRHSSRTRP